MRTNQWLQIAKHTFNTLLDTFPVSFFVWFRCADKQDKSKECARADIKPAEAMRNEDRERWHGRNAHGCHIGRNIANWTTFWSCWRPNKGHWRGIFCCAIPRKTWAKKIWLLFTDCWRLSVKKPRAPECACAVPAALSQLGLNQATAQTTHVVHYRVTRK